MIRGAETMAEADLEESDGRFQVLAVREPYDLPSRFMSVQAIEAAD